MKQVLYFFISWKILCFIVVFVAMLLLPFYGKFILNPTDRLAYPYLLWIWGNFDGYHYITIARSGYGTFQNPFFPFYPLCIQLFSIFSHLPHLMSALVISNVTFFFSLVTMLKNLEMDNKKQLGFLFLLIIILYPTSFFYGAAYNDSIFLLLSSLTIYYSRKKSWVLACSMAALATLTRLNGLALGFLILLEYLQSDNKNFLETWNFRHLLSHIKQKLTIKNIYVSKIYALALIPGAFIGYLFFTHIVYGDWYKVFSSMQVWNQDKVTFPLQVFWRYFKIIVFDPTLKINYFVAILELSFVFFYIGILIYTYKKIRFSYWLLFLLSIIIPSLTGTFAGMPRYALHIYPFFLAVTIFLSQQKRPVQVIYFLVSLGLFIYCLTLFSRGYFVS